MTQQKGIEVCGVMVFFMLTQSHICNISMGARRKKSALQCAIMRCDALKTLTLKRGCE